MDGAKLTMAIAQSVWGDSSLWYLIADANGLSGDETLQAGQTLVIPNKIHNIHNSATTYRVYDPNEAIGDTAPTVPRPKQHGGCGVFGQILQAIIAIVVTIATGGNAVLGDLASQLFGLATGNQKSFNWKELAIAELTAGVNDGIEAIGGLALTGNAIIDGALHYAAANAITQGISVATGLQKKFDWTAVAAAAVTGGVTGGVSQALNGYSFASDPGVNGGIQGFISSMAGGIAGAATRTLIDGTDFGDNLIAVLPDVIGGTIHGAQVGLNSGSQTDFTQAGKTGTSLPETQAGKFGLVPVPITPQKFSADELLAPLPTLSVEPAQNSASGTGGSLVRVASNGPLSGILADSAPSRSSAGGVNFVEVTPEQRIQKLAVAFVGGFSDRTNGSTANRVFDYATEFARQNSNVDSEYFSFDAMGDLSKWVQSKIDSNEQIVLIGQSLGGANAAMLTTLFPHQISLLVTIDPVEGSLLVPGNLLAYGHQISASVNNWVDVEGAFSATDFAGSWGALPQYMGDNVKFYDPKFPHADIGSNMNFLLDQHALPSGVNWLYTNYGENSGKLYYTTRRD